MTGLFLFTLIFIIAQFLEKSDYDRMKEAEKLTFTKQQSDKSHGNKL